MSLHTTDTEEDMKNKELITELSKRLNLPPQDVAETLAVFASVVGSRLVDNDTVYLQGLGQFEVKKKMERISVNPSNGKRYLVPPKLVPVFKPGMTMRTKLKEMKEDE